MKISELIGEVQEVPKVSDKHDLLDEFYIWTTNEEDALLEKLKTPVKLSTLDEQDQFKIQSLIRKSLVTKIGWKDPSVVANEKAK